MTSVIPRSSINNGVPQTQNTAPVLEYRCLYTRDIKRKQKRWQDGVLRFHTFNKRIMVYDTSGGYIGDKHWKEESLLTEGDELQLDSPVLIEVQESVSQTETDLTALFEWKNSGPKNGSPDSPLRRTPSVSRQPTVIKATGLTQLVPARHKSLNAMLGLKKGFTGKAALPLKSPYNQRQEEQESENGNQKSAKRPRLDGIAGTKFGLVRERAGTTLSNRMEAVASTFPPSTNTWTSKAQALSSDAIILSPDLDDPKSDVTILSPQFAMPDLAESRLRFDVQRPAKIAAQPRTTAVAAVTPNPVAWPSAAPQRKPKEKSPIPEPMPLPCPQGHAAALAAQHIPTEIIPIVHTEKPTITQAQPSQARALRIVKAPPRRMLLCNSLEPIRKSKVAAKFDAVAVDVPRAAMESTIPKRTEPGSGGGRKYSRKRSILEELDAELSETEGSSTAKVGLGKAKVLDSMSTRQDHYGREGKESNDSVVPSINRLGLPDAASMAPVPAKSQLQGFAFVGAGAHGIGIDGKPDGFQMAPSDRMPRDQDGSTTAKWSPSKRARSPLSRSKSLSTTGTSAKHTKSPFSKAKSLSTTDAGDDILAKTSKASKTKAVTEAKAKRAPKVDRDIGPWSTEACDLFDWRPPGL